MTGVARGGTGAARREAEGRPQAADLLRLLARGLSLTEIARRQGVGRPELARELLRLAEGLEQDAVRPGAPERAASAGPRAGASPALVAYTDGASRGNPGPAGIGVVLLRDGQVLAEKGQPIGNATNNVAEYRAVIAALEMARTYGARRLEVRVDSELVARQLGGRYRVREPHLAELVRAVQTLAGELDEVHWVHVPRGENARADALANQALDRGS